MKKAFAFFLALLLILPLLPSCGEKEPAETTAENNTQAAPENQNGE